MTEEYQYYSPKLERAVPREVVRLADRRNLGEISRTRYVNRMKRLGFTTGQADTVFYEFQRGALWVEWAIPPPPPPPPAKQRIWEFTRYYKYVNAKRPSDNRHFEVRLYLPFPARFTANNLIDYEAQAEELCNVALNEAFGQIEYDPKTFEIMEAWMGEDLEKTSVGWEPAEETEPRADSPVMAESKVWDKLERYWKGFKTVYHRWEIPE